MNEMSSRLVETVMINVEDFAESFLTCGTCLSGYNAGDHSPKLLPCSHTVCRTCLERILETQVRTDAFRCPICREGITVPRGGAAAFPPAFIVNQLLDLLASQRRDVVPKCSLHPSQELLFCETCDMVFCADCCGGHGVHTAPSDCASEGGAVASTATAASTLTHNVITFNVAIKRCSEILLYKAHLCIKQLDNARDNIRQELGRLSENSGLCDEAVNASFAELQALVAKRHQEMLHLVRRLTEEKRRGLTDQLNLIEAERETVRQECDRINDQLDVRTISKGISYLNDKLDKVVSLTEPRENAYLRYQYQPDLSLPELARYLSGFGRVSVSTTYPPLCSAKLPYDPAPAVHMRSKVMIHTVDYHGMPQTHGGDPVEIDLTSPRGRPILLQPLIDRDNGSYELQLRPTEPGLHRLAVRILGRPIRGSPFVIDVAQHQKPCWSFNEGWNGRHLLQPFAVAHSAVNPFLLNPQQEPMIEATAESAAATGVLYLLDTGNSRILVVDASTGRALRQVGEAVMQGQAGTGVALAVTKGGHHQLLWVVNWRLKQICLLDPLADKVVERVSSPDFVEPTSLCVSGRTGDVYVADNGSGQVLVCSRPATGSGGNSASHVRPLFTAAGKVKRVNGICLTPKEDHLLLATNSALQMVSLTSPSTNATSSSILIGRGHFCAVATVPGLNSNSDLVLATRTDRAHSVVAVFELSASTAERGVDPGAAAYEIEMDPPFKRLAGLVPIAPSEDNPDQQEVVVVDLGGQALHRIRYF